MSYPCSYVYQLDGKTWNTEKEYDTRDKMFSEWEQESRRYIQKVFWEIWKSSGLEVSWGAWQTHVHILIMSNVRSGRISHIHFALSAKRWRKHSVKRLKFPEWLAKSLGRENSNQYLSQKESQSPSLNRNRIKMTERAIFVTTKDHHDVRSEEFGKS